MDAGRVEARQVRQPRRGVARLRVGRPHRRAVGQGRDADHRRGVGVRIEHGEVVVGDVHAVDGTVGVHGRVALVGGRLVVDLAHLVGPLPLGEDQIPFHSLRPRRRRRRLAGRDAVAPVGEHRQSALAPEARHPHAHLGPALPHPHARVPGVGARVVPLRVRVPARELAPDLVTAQAGLHVVEVLVARPELLADAVAAGAGARKLVRLGRLDQRQPVRGRIHRRGFLRGPGNDGRQREVFTRRGRDRRRIDQPVAAHPDRIGRIRKLRQQEPPVVAGHHDLAELRRQVAGLGDDPDAGFGAGAAGHDAGDGRGIAGLCAHHQSRRSRRQERPHRQPFECSSHRDPPQVARSSPPAVSFRR